jgi:hypothetical protein
MFGTLWLLLQAGYLYDAGVSNQAFLLAVLTVGEAMLQTHYFPSACVCEIIRIINLNSFFCHRYF